jgi:hypothetical protein
MGYDNIVASISPDQVVQREATEEPINPSALVGGALFGSDGQFYGGLAEDALSTVVAKTDPERLLGDLNLAQDTLDAKTKQDAAQAEKEAIEQNDAGSNSGDSECDESVDAYMPGVTDFF